MFSAKCISLQNLAVSHGVQLGVKTFASFFCRHQNALPWNPRPSALFQTPVSCLAFEGIMEPDLKAVPNSCWQNFCCLPRRLATFYTVSHVALHVSIVEKTIPELGMCSLVILTDDYSADQSDVYSLFGVRLAFSGAASVSNISFVVWCIYGHFLLFSASQTMSAGSVFKTPVTLKTSLFFCVMIIKMKMVGEKRIADEDEGKCWLWIYLYLIQYWKCWQN